MKHSTLARSHPGTPFWSTWKSSTTSCWTTICTEERCQTSNQRVFLSKLCQVGCQKLLLNLSIKLSNLWLDEECPSTSKNMRLVTEDSPLLPLVKQTWQCPLHQTLFSHPHDPLEWNAQEKNVLGFITHPTNVSQNQLTSSYQMSGWLRKKRKDLDKSSWNPVKFLEWKK